MSHKTAWLALLLVLTLGPALIPTGQAHLDAPIAVHLKAPIEVRDTRQARVNLPVEVRDTGQARAGGGARTERSLPSPKGGSGQLREARVMSTARSASPRPGRVLPRRRVLRVCSDPNNLPFSNNRQEGFENRIAALVASDLDARLEYTWWAQRRGFFRNTLKAGRCDVVMGVPASFELALPTRPYYRSTYVFVSRRDRHLGLSSFDDPRLARLRIGVQLIGDDGANAPPAHALANRGMVANVVGYTVYGDYRRPNPPARIVAAVAAGEVDAAVVWGPLAGYFAARQRVPLDIAPVSPQIDLPFLPFVYDIAMGVRRGDTALRDELDGVILRRRAEIDRILDEYRVPRPQRPVDPAERRAAS